MPQPISTDLSTDTLLRDGLELPLAAAPARQDICLVCMPDSPVALPPIGLGLLHAILDRAGFAVKALYANLWFTEFVGFDSRRLIKRTRVEDLAMDWLFAGSAFRDAAPLQTEFIDKLFERNSSLRRMGQSGATEFFVKLRHDSERFIDSAAERVLEHQPRIVGCTSTFQQHVPSLALLRRIRELAPDVVTMMGGANCESRMGVATHRAFPWVDYVVSGEADDLIAPLCRAAIAEGREIAASDLPIGVFGPAHRESGYPVVKAGDGAPRATVASVADIPIPNYDDYFAIVDGTSFRDRIQPAISFESSRGCWWGEISHCTFCGLNGGSMRYRAKDGAVVAGEIEELYRRYQSSDLHAVDNIIDMRYFETLLPDLAQRNLPIRVFYEAKANLKRSHIEMLHSAGVRWVQPGIESLCTGVLKLIGKGLTAVQNVQLLKHTRQVGIRLIWNSMLGLPGERDEWYAESAAWIPLISHFQPGTMGWLRYDRYSVYFMHPERYGLDLHPAPSYRDVYPIPDDELSDLAYFFEHRGAAVRPKLDGGGPSRLNLDDQFIPDDGPGRVAYRDAIVSWQETWSRAVPVLQFEDVDGTLRIEDTRPIAPEPFTTVDGLAREVMLLLNEESFTRAQICARLAETSAASEANETIDTLIRRKLVLELDNKVVNLVLAGPVPQLPDAWLSRTAGPWA
jgi:ribosomal peptide maturation radical SAM protein 1